MEGTKIKCRVWAIGIYLFTNNINGISSIRMHHELGICQKAAWLMLYRLRTTFDVGARAFSGPVEMDEAYVGGEESNKHRSKKLNATHRLDHNPNHANNDGE